MGREADDAVENEHIRVVIVNHQFIIIYRHVTAYNSLAFLFRWPQMIQDRRTDNRVVASTNS